MSLDPRSSPSGTIGWPRCLLAALGLLAATETPGRAEVDAEIFAGAHIFSDANRLSRADNPTDGNVFRHSGLFGLRLGYVPIPRLALEAELAMIPTSTRDDASRLGVLALRGHLLFNILTGRVRPFLLLGGGGMFSTPTTASMLRAGAEGELHAGAGLKIDFVKNWGIRLDGRAVFPQALTKPFTVEGEALVSLYGRFDVAAAPPPAPLPVDSDSDQDGVADSEDRCVSAAGPRENNGCPDTDQDGDGIVDRLDRCPTVAGAREHGGCTAPDRDGDGIPDASDRCPAESGLKENGGCPDKDGDGDGIIDRLDRCPGQPETRNSYQDEDGCPDVVPAAVAKFTGAIQGVSFKTNQAVLTKESLPTLDRAVAVLREYASVRLEIAGHTDDSGKADKNRELSQARAEAVRAYLIKQGVDGARLTSVGYGPDKPVASNDTTAGRAKNRRVEFVLRTDPAH